MGQNSNSVPVPTLVQRQTDMELDRALELAVASSWEELVKPGETCSVHVKYENMSPLPLGLLEVWTVKNRGYGTLVCRYSVEPSNSAPPASEGPTILFANSYHSKRLSDNLDFILRNQSQFTRPPDRSIRGLVRIDCPSEESRNDAATWSREALTGSAETIGTRARRAECASATTPQPNRAN